MSNNRPLSPHLQIYRLPITGIISISHRLTGVFLVVGLVGFIFMLAQVKNGMLSYLEMQTLLQTAPMQLLLSGFIFALMFHSCHGVRHLIWDAGYSFSPKTLTRNALLEIFTSLILTGLTLVVVL
jgi:succinate dehydrogenase / fumarate reductase cytochrome b subunit